MSGAAVVTGGESQVAPWPVDALPMVTAPRVLNVLAPGQDDVTAEPAKGKVLADLMRVRDEYAEIATRGRFKDAASREWGAIPLNWRMNLLLVAGIGVDADDLEALARRRWDLFSPHERNQLRMEIRTGKRALAHVVALAARVVEVEVQ
ncbi:hypothetical protein [Acidovorax sp. Leaf160]|uniref:hypothetical protein n=1 Tax=Acidovorax sp. Leaf160 TaxID=1736280 RepID=UPI0006FE3522|nr:hypothetical protein [Acidovorax sp. Leaf160]KQR50133.1 hypothetical protein ASF94_06505 [Acidovorax sp. Leaf160]